MVSNLVCGQFAVDKGFDCHPLAILLASEHNFNALGS